MAKTIILGKTPYRVLRRDSLSISLHPVDSEYPHSLLLRDPPYKTAEEPANPRWGHNSRGRRDVTWYRQISDDVFEKVTRGKRAHAVKKSSPTKRADKLGHPDRIMLDGKRLTIVSDRPTRLRDGTVKLAVNTEYSTVAHHVVLPADEMVEVGWS